MGFFWKTVNNIDLLGNRFYKFTVEYQSNLSYQITKKKCQQPQPNKQLIYKR